MYRLSRKALSVAVLLGIILAGSSGSVGWAVAAHEVNWDNTLDVNVQVTQDAGITWKSWYQPHCHPHVAMVEDYSSREMKEVCSVKSQHAELAVYQQTPDGPTMYALSIDGDDTLHRISRLTPMPSHLVLLPDDTILGASQDYEDIFAMYSLDDFHMHAVTTPIGTGPLSHNDVYDIDRGDAAYFVDREGRSLPARISLCLRTVSLRRYR